MERYLVAAVRADLGRKMVFLSGPRQVGKTTLAKSLLTTEDGYLSWDIPDHCEQLLLRQLPAGSPLWVLDELHKFRGWRNYLKGLYDQFGSTRQILVTGSARLDLYRRGGDSLQGRYHFLRLHPLSVAELRAAGQDGGLDGLLNFGGFPEPFFARSENESRRWSREHRSRMVREEISSVEQVQDWGRLEHLALRLPELAGSPLSLNALREDLQVAHKTVSRWLDILERLYAIFRLSPFGAPKIRAVRKERKHYHMDWLAVKDLPLRFENMVACHLLKWVHFKEDTEGRDMELRYFRDVDRREVDFVVTEDRRPILFVECKWEDGGIDRGLRYLKARFPGVESWQISARGKMDYISGDGIRVAPAEKLLAALV